jgi:hypothetical protein
MAEWDELTDEQRAAAFRNDRLMRQLINDPRSRADTAKWIKEVAPEYKNHFPDTDISSLKADIERQREEDKLAREREKIEAKLQAQKSRLAEKYEPSQIEEIEKLMQEHGISNYDIGAKLYAADMPPPEEGRMPVGRQGERWEFPDLENYKKDPMGAAAKSAYAEIDRMNAQRRASRY